MALFIFYARLEKITFFDERRVDVLILCVRSCLCPVSGHV